MTESYIEIDLKTISDSDFQKFRVHANPELFYLKINSKRKRYCLGDLFGGHYYNDNLEISEPHRQALLSFFDEFCTDFITNGKSLVGLETTYRCVESFFGWARENLYYDLLSSPGAVSDAFYSYVAHLDSLLLNGVIQKETAMRRESSVIMALRAMTVGQFEISLQGIRKYRSNNSGSSPTKLPGEDDLAKALSLSDALFNNISDFLLNNKPYPHLLSLPHEKCWIFPAKIWTVPSFFRREKLPFLASKVWDYDNGTLRSIESLIPHYNMPRSGVAAIHKRNEDVLHKSNLDPRYETRLRLAVVASRAFYFLFNNIIAANASFYEDLKWGEDYVFSKGPRFDGVQFVNIKRRASRKVLFRITKEFKPAFDKYLLLRKYMLGSEVSELLFFQYSKQLEVVRLPPNLLWIYFEQINTLVDDSIISVCNRAVRARKGDRLNNLYGSQVASEALQNSPYTSGKHYSTGSESTQSIELTYYFDFLKNKIVDVHNVGNYPNLIATAIASCGNYGNPSSETVANSILPDCKDPQGCLGCDHLTIHADKLGVHKILSMRYVLNEVGALIYPGDHFQKMVGSSVDKINEALKEISSRSVLLKNMVEDVSRLVDGGELTEYWERKLNVLIELGVLG